MVQYYSSVHRDWYPHFSFSFQSSYGLYATCRVWNQRPCISDWLCVHVQRIGLFSSGEIVLGVMSGMSLVLYTGRLCNTYGGFFHIHYE